MSKTSRLVASLLLTAAAVFVGVAPCAAGAAESAGATRAAVADTAVSGIVAPQQTPDCGACWASGT